MKNGRVIRRCGLPVLWCLALVWPLSLSAQQSADMDATVLATPAVVQSEAAQVADALAEPAAGAVAESPEPVKAVAVPGSELASMTGPLIRMVLSLTAVLALVGALAWVAKRFRGVQLQGGLIQIAGSLSLGPKDRVVLLRVGDEEVLVGLSQTGMRPLHVMAKPTSPARFSLNMEDQE